MITNFIAKDQDNAITHEKTISVIPNDFTNIVRAMRQARGELLGDMANKLGVSSAYLSRIENGFSKPSPKLISNIIEVYNLTGKEQEALEAAGYTLQDRNLFDISRMRVRDKKLMIVLGKRLHELSDEQVEAILQIVEPKEDNL